MEINVIIHLEVLRFSRRCQAASKLAPIAKAIVIEFIGSVLLERALFIIEGPSFAVAILRHIVRAHLVRLH